MTYEAVVISGTRGSGKSSLADALEAADARLRVVRAVTTRAARADDRTGRYEYVDLGLFTELSRDGSLAVATQYSGEHYGIRKVDVEAVESSGQTPVLVVAPAVFGDVCATKERVLSVFLDASDGVLDSRLIARAKGQEHRNLAERSEDRRFAEEAVYRLTGGETSERVALVRSLIRIGTGGGVLSKRLIRQFVRCGELLQDADEEQIKSASYDLRLGDEYFYAGRIHVLSGNAPILLIEPYDYAIVTSHEKVRLPRDVAGRFDLSVNLFCQGIVLSNGPQVDPGFTGTLFCLLLNTSSKPVLLKRRQHYATLELQRMVEPTVPYSGQYQGKTLIDYLPSSAAQGAINELKKEIELLRKESQSLQAVTWAIVAVVLALVSIWVSIRG